MVEKYIEIDGLTLHYIDNEVQSSEIVFIFPPGIEDARFIEYFSPDKMYFRTIAISYPSRYKSDPLGDAEDSSDKIAVYTSKLVVELSKGAKHLNLVGFSFGTMIITKILQQHYDAVAKPFGDKIEVILVNAGEFFPDNFVPTFKKIFTPLQENEMLRELVRKAVTKIPFVKDDQLVPENSKNLNAQWLDVLEYRINLEKSVDVSTKIIIGDHDQLIKSGSLEKLAKVFTRASFSFYGGGHIIDYLTDKNTAKVVDIVKTELNKK